MERAGVAARDSLMALPTFVSDEALAPGATLTLGEDAAHHMRVRRLDVGARVRVLDGQGMRGEGLLVQLAKRHASVTIETAEQVPPPSPIHLLLPVADKDRMLWLAEKAAELGVASWRPVMFRRSKHVTPRGEGPTFQQKLRARMVSALEQSGSAWLPTMFPEATVEHAIAARPDGAALLLDAEGDPLLDVLGRERAPLGGLAAAAFAVPDPAVAPDAARTEAVTLVVGPEGGLEPAERDAFVAGGFHLAALGASVLRFETAAIAAVAAVRAALERGGR